MNSTEYSEKTNIQKKQLHYIVSIESMNAHQQSLAIVLAHIELTVV